MSLILRLLAQIATLKKELQSVQSKYPTSIQPLVFRTAQKVLKEMGKMGYDVMVYQGYRSIEEQDALYAQGRTKPGAKVTNARGGDSFHNYGVAIDIVFVVNGKPSWSNNHAWKTLGNVGKKHGFEWGGDWTDFPDRPHFQMTMGYTLSDFKNNRVDYSKYV